MVGGERPDWAECHHVSRVWQPKPMSYSMPAATDTFEDFLKGGLSSHLHFTLIVGSAYFPCESGLARHGGSEGAHTHTPFHCTPCRGGPFGLLCFLIQKRGK